MNIHKDEGFLFSSSVLAVGLVVLVAMIALSVILWGSGSARNTPADVQRTHRDRAAGNRRPVFLPAAALA